LVVVFFRDVRKPLPDSVDLLEEIVIEFITEMTKKAMQIGSKRGRLHVDDIVLLIRRDRKKFERVKELFAMHKEIKRMKKAFDLRNVDDIQEE